MSLEPTAVRTQDPGALPWGGAEARRFQRIKLPPINLVDADASVFDLSEGGICLVRRAPIQVGAIHELRLAVPSAAETERINAEVRWQRGRHVGLRWVDPTPGQLRLLRACLRGWRSTETEQDEREALFASFQPLIRRLTRYYGLDQDLQQDLYGEIYYQFCALLDRYDPARGVPRRAYLATTLKAAIHTYTRRHWRRRQREVSLEGTLEMGDDLDLTAPEQDWDGGLMMDAMREALPAALQLLPARQRQVVIWRYYESRSFDEIAGRLDVKPATARSLLRHGIHSLRRHLATLIPE